MWWIEYWKKIKNSENVVHLGIFGILGILKLSVIPFNTIEYWKCSILKFQYYWILKMCNTEISILLNIENVQYRIFNTIEYRKKCQSRTSIIPKIIFNISPHPTLYKPYLDAILNNFKDHHHHQLCWSCQYYHSTYRHLT